MPDPTSAVDDLDEATSSLLRLGDLQHPRQRPDQHVCHLLRPHTGSRMKAEASSMRFNQGPLLARLPADLLVLRQHDPASSARLAQPDLVVGVLVEDVVVRDERDVRIRRPKASRDLPASETPIDEDVRLLAARGSALPL